MSTRNRSAIISSAKGFERKVAKMARGRRNPSTGLKDEIDVESDDLGIQTKKGQRLPGYLGSWLKGIVESVGTHAPGKLPMIVWNHWGADATEAVVVMRFGDFLKYRDKARGGNEDLLIENRLLRDALRAARDAAQRGLGE